MMKKMKSILLVLVISFASVMLCGCGDKGDIKGLMKEFESACNDLDIDAMLDCLNPKIADTVNTTLGLVGMFTDTDTDTMLDSISKALLGGTEEGENGSEFFSTIQIDVEEIDAGKNSATVDVEISYEVNGETIDKPAEFTCNYSDEDEKWYISNVSFK